VFPGHQLVEKIGEGRMGEVLLARQCESGKHVAIKVLHRRLSASPDLVRRFEREILALSQLRQDNVVEIYHAGRCLDGRLYFVMEWVDGIELGRLMLEQMPMPAWRIQPLLAQICAALRAAHARGIVHRDLKPGNILLRVERPGNSRLVSLRLKLVDFGLAKFITGQPAMQKIPSETVNGLILGTPITMAPEQALGLNGEIGAHTDIYAVGVMLYWMLCGEHPFSRWRGSEMIAQHAHGEPPRLRRRNQAISPAIEGLVHRCLSKDPAARPSAEELSFRFSSAVLQELEEPDRPVVGVTMRLVDEELDASYNDGPTAVGLASAPTIVIA
jgi:serine/threonine-protein kinase